MIHTAFVAGMSLPGAHVEESWQSAEFYNNKVGIQFVIIQKLPLQWSEAKIVKGLQYRERSTNQLQGNCKE